MMFKQVGKFIGEVRKIVSEITWPDRKTLIQLTIVVILLSSITGLVLAAADFGLTKLISSLANK